MAASGSREGGGDASRTDMAWQYCVAIDGDRKKTQCKFCGKKLMSGGITRLKQHLAGTSTDVAKCALVPVEITRAVAAQIKGGQQRRAEKEKSKMLFEDTIRGTVRGLDDDSSDDDGMDYTGMSEQEARDVRRATMASKVSLETDRDRLRQRAAGASGSGSFQQPEPQTRSKGGLGSMFRRSQSTRQQPQAPPPQARDEDIEILYQDPAVFRKTGAKQKRLKSMWNWKGTKEFIGDAYARWSIFNSIPANASGGPYYQPLFDAVAEAGPGVKAPTAYEVMNVYLPRLKRELEVWIGELKSHWDTYGVTVMCDGWTGPTRKSIINFMVYSDGKTSFLKSVDASAVTKDANYIYGLLQTVVNEVGASNVVQIVTDNGSNYKKAGEMMMANMNYNLFWTPCAAHCIDLMLKDMGKIQKIKQVVEQARHVTTFVYNHGYSLNLLRQKCGGDLVRPGITRFATNYIALKSFEAKMVGLRSMFASEEWFGWRESASQAGVQAQTIIASDEFWRTLKDVVRILEPVVKVLRLVDTSFQPTMPHLFAAMDMLKERIHAVLPRGNKHFLKIIKDRWENQLMHPLHKAAYYLNPKYQYSHVLGLNTDLIGAVKDVVAKLVPDYTIQALINLQIKTFRDAHGSFGSPAAVAGRENTDPAEWWLLYGEHALELRRIAIKILSQTCSASGCERNWSTFSLIHSKRRNRLGSQRLNDLVYVHYNMRLRHQCSKHKQQNEQSLIELADVFDLSSEDEDPYVEWVRDRAVPVMDVSGGMPDPTIATPMGSNLDRFVASDEGRVHIESPRPFDPPAGSDPAGDDDDTIDESGWSASDSGGGGGDSGGGGGGGGIGTGASHDDPLPTVPIIRWTGESEYTHATQDPDHGGRASSSRSMAGYTRRRSRDSRQRERHLQPVEEDDDRFIEIIPDPDILPDVDIDSMSTSFGGMSIEGGSGQEQGQFSAHGFGTTSAYGSYSGDDSMMGSAYDYSADGSNATSQTGSNFVDSLFSVPNVQRTTPPHQPLYAHFTPHYTELYPRLGIFINFPDNVYNKYVEDYLTFFRQRMSWQDFVYQTEAYFLQQSQHDQFEPARHSTYD